MSVKYILGGPGTGKSTRLMEDLIQSAIAHPDQRHIMLVPEQYTMQTQRDIVRLHPLHAAMNIDILSFERLAYRVMGELGRENMKILTGVGKNMLLRRSSAEREKDLSIFRRSLKKPGFVNRLMSLLSEFYQYGITDAKLAELEEKLADRPLVQMKIRDLRVFYSSLESVKGEETIAPEELLTLLERLLPQSLFLNNTVIAMDNFTGFTPVQYRIIGEMMKRCSHMEMALLLPKEEWREESREQDLFHMSQVVVFTCDRMAREAGLDTSIEYREENCRHADAPELKHLSDHFLRDGKHYAGENKGAIRGITLRNPREEAENAAAEIRHLVMDEGLRYRDIAVVIGALEEYRPYLESAFRRYQIPLFMDLKRGILGDPLVEFLRSSMAVIAEDYSYESVMRYLRCGIEVIPQEDVDLLDNYLLACRVRGRKRWDSEWIVKNSESSETSERLNQARIQVLHSLAPMDATRHMFWEESPSGDEEGEKIRIAVSERTAVLREMMENHQTASQMETLAGEMERKGRVDLRDEYEAANEYVLGLLDQMDELMGDESISLREFADVLDAGLAEARLGQIPSALDRVQVGDLMRSRLRDIRVLMILGFNEDLIPGSHQGGGILSETERELLEGLDLVLAPSAEHLANQEQFYLYRLLTRPSGCIRISASRLAPDGSSRKISHLWNQLSSMFPQLTMEDGEKSVEWRPVSEEQAWRLFSGELRELRKESGQKEEWRELGQILREMDPNKMESLIEAAFPKIREDHISEAAARALYGTELRGSVTRLEKYAGCAYAHFLQYGLRLLERETGEITGRDRGDFFHKVLQVFFQLCEAGDLQPGHLTESQRKDMVGSSVRRAMEQIVGTRGLDEGSQEYLMRRWEIMADRTLWAVCMTMGQEAFSTKATELKFDGKTAPSMRFDLGNGMEMNLSGTVDRLDAMPWEKDYYLRIVDYKTSNVSLDMNLIENGLQLQLPLYMDAMVDRERHLHPERQVAPAGICYYHLDEPLAELEAGEQELDPEKLLKLMEMNGLFLDSDPVVQGMNHVKGDRISGEQFDRLCEHTVRKTAQFGREIAGGRIAVDPYRYESENACTYCKFTGVCGFNQRREGNKYRKIAKAKKDAVWKRLEEE